MKKTFSIVIPVHNGEKTIERTLASFISSKDYICEVIIVNDRSTDKTLSKIKPFTQWFNIKVINNKGAPGPGAARKTGLLAAKGEWITFVDADDCLTPSALRYVQQEINQNQELVVLYTQTIYYEFGSVVPENIECCDGSCGGNYYKRQYLIDNNLLPHDTLKMSEDEYFNHIIDTFIHYYSKFNNEMIDHYQYPTYEVHHDEYGASFAHANWIDYAIKYHLLSSIYYIQYFQQFKNSDMHMLEREFLSDFIFVYYVFMCSLQDDSLIFDIQEQFTNFQDAYKFYKKTFKKNKSDIIDWFKRHQRTAQSMREGALASCGVELENEEPFEDFINRIAKGERNDN